MANVSGFESTAVFTRRNDLHADFYELTVLLPTRIRVPVSNLNLVMDGLGLGASGETKKEILSLVDGQTLNLPVTVALETVDKLKQFAE